MKPLDFVKNDNTAYFQFFRNGVLYYNVRMCGTIDLYQFQIPIDDLGNATVNHTEKALTLMRYIRKSLDDGTMIKVDV